MRKIFTGMMLCAIGCVNAPAQNMAELPKDLRNFAESASMMLDAVANHDRALLMDAAEGFNSYSVSELSPDDYVFSENAAGDLMDPVVRFTESYCNALLKNGFTLIEMDEPEELRAIPPFLDMVSKGISPGGEVSFTFIGQDNMGLVIAESSPVLGVALEAYGVEIPLSELSGGCVKYASWDLGPDETPFTVTVSNPTENVVSFTLALQ